MVDLVDEGFDLAIRIGEIHQEDLVARYLAPYRMVICAAPAYLARYGTPGTPEDLADHICLSHTVWTARNEWRLPGVEGEVRWKRDAVLRCNDGYALRQAAIAGAGLLTALSLSFSAEGFLRTAQILFLAHIPVMIVEGVITALAVSFIAKVRPEILQFSKE